MMFLVRQCPNNGLIRGLFSMYLSTNSAAANPHNNLLVEMLVNSLGFSTKKAISTTAKVTRSKPQLHKPKLVIDFFKQQVGLDKSHIKSIVTSWPNVLYANVDKTLKPKIKFFQDELGFTGPDLAKLLSKGGTLLTSSLDKTIRPNLDYFRKLLGTDDSVTKIIKRNPRVVWYNAPKLMSPSITFLQNNGFLSKDIQRLILHSPMLLLRKNTEWLEKAVHRVDNDLHIPRHSTMFIYGLITFATLGESPLEMKLETFRRFGWSDLEILKLAQQNPLCFSLSESKVGNALNFFMKELGYGADILISRPILLTCSLEKRALPRHEILKLLDHKNLGKRSRKLYNVVQMTDSVFLKTYVLPFKDEMPELYELYMKSRR